MERIGTEGRKGEKMQDLNKNMFSSPMEGRDLKYI